jgi:hypothetical protein
LKRLLCKSNTQAANDRMSGLTYTHTRTATTFGTIKLSLSTTWAPYFRGKNQSPLPILKPSNHFFFLQHSDKIIHSYIFTAYGQKLARLRGGRGSFIHTGSVYMVSQNHVRVSPPSCDSEWPHSLPQPYRVYPQP